MLPILERTLGGLAIGTDSYKNYNFNFSYSEKYDHLFFSYSNGIYEQLESTISDLNIGDAALVSISLDDDKNISSIFILDSNIAKTYKFDN